jgi:hypothetical protein
MAEGTFRVTMVLFGLFCLVAGAPTYFFLRRIRALHLTRGYAVVLTVPVVIALWLILGIIVDIGRL